MGELNVIPCKIVLGSRGEYDALIIGRDVFFKVRGRWRSISIANFPSAEDFICGQNKLVDYMCKKYYNDDTMTSSECQNGKGDYINYEGLL